MEAFLLWAAKYGYAAIFGYLMLAGLGLPFPEDIPLVAGGYLCSRGALYTVPTIAVGMLGVMLGDSFIFFLGTRAGSFVDGNAFFRRHLGGKRKAKVAKYFDKYGNRTVFVGRFLPGLRAPIFFSAGVSGMRYRTFALHDGAAAIVSVPLLVVLGEQFAPQIDQLLGWILAVKQGALVLFLVAALLAVIVYRRRRDAATDDGPSESPATSDEDHPAPSQPPPGRPPTG